jgi:uncharacterized membrane protein
MRGGSRSLLPALVALALAFSSPALIRADGQGSIRGQVSISPLLVSLTLSTTTAVVGKALRADVRVTNVGPERVSNVIVEVRAATDGLRIRKDTPQTIAKLKPGESGLVTYTICGQKPGSYVVLARATLAGTSVDSPARLLTITAGKERGC